MRILFLITLSFIINICAQFTSGTDYSGKTVEVNHKNEIGLVISTVKSDIKWEFVSQNDINLKANSNMSGFGYGLFLNIPADGYLFFFKGGHIYRDISNSASKYEYVTEGEDPVYSNIDVEDFSLNQIRAESGMEFLKNYKLSVKADFISENNENSLQFGGSAEYKAEFNSRQLIKALIEFNSEGNNDFPAEKVSFTDMTPFQLYRVGFIQKFDSSEFSSGAKYLKYYSTSVNDRETDYLNFELEYDRSFNAAGTDVSVSAGSNLTTDFSSPEINLPYFYYNVRFGTEMLKGKVGLNIGWNYGMYSIALGDRIMIPDEELVLLPENIEDISEEIGSYTLDIKLSYRF